MLQHVSRRAAVQVQQLVKQTTRDFEVIPRPLAPGGGLQTAKVSGRDTSVSDDSSESSFEEIDTISIASEAAGEQNAAGAASEAAGAGAATNAAAGQAAETAAAGQSQLLELLGSAQLLAAAARPVRPDANSQLAKGPAGDVVAILRVLFIGDSQESKQQALRALAGMTFRVVICVCLPWMQFQHWCLIVHRCMSPPAAYHHEVPGVRVCVCVCGRAACD
jgi:hypothetical protein